MTIRHFVMLSFRPATYRNVFLPYKIMGLSKIDSINLSTLAFAEKVYEFAESTVVEKSRRVSGLTHVKYDYKIEYYVKTGDFCMRMDFGS